MAIFLLSGCADGPFAELAGWNPWLRREWREDEEYAPTFHQRLADLRAIQSNASRLSPAEQDRFVGEMLQLARNDPNPLLRAESVRTLSRFATPTVLPGLRLASRDENVYVRIAACEAWGQRGDMEALEALADIIRREEKLDVRIAATHQLGRFQDPAAISALGLALNDSDPALQYRAVQSLKSSTGRDFGDSVPAWRDYVAGRNPEPGRSPSVVERLSNFF